MTDQRLSLDSMIVGICLVLRSWYRSGHIDELDSGLIDTAEKDALEALAKLPTEYEQSAAATAWLNEPEEAFEDNESSCRGRNVTIAVDRAFRYGKARNCLVRLGRAVGFEKQLEWYDLRRGSGKKLNSIMWIAPPPHPFRCDIADSRP